jgi:hypothetical protein
MFAYILRYGFIAGLIVATPMVWRMLAAKPGATEEPVSGMLLGYLTMIVALTAVFLGVKQYRDRAKGGVIRFLPAFGVGLGISVVASLIYMLSWEVSIALSPFDFAAWWQHQMIDGAKAHGATAAAWKSPACCPAKPASYWRAPGASRSRGRDTCPDRCPLNRRRNQRRCSSQRRFSKRHRRRLAAPASADQR